MRRPLFPSEPNRALICPARVCANPARSSRLDYGPDWVRLAHPRMPNRARGWLSQARCRSAGSDACFAGESGQIQSGSMAALGCTLAAFHRMVRMNLRAIINPPDDDGLHTAISDPPYVLFVCPSRLTDPSRHPSQYHYACLTSVTLATKRQNAHRRRPGVRARARPSPARPGQILATRFEASGRPTSRSWQRQAPAAAQPSIDCSTSYT